MTKSHVWNSSSISNSIGALQDLVDDGFLTLYAVKRPKGQMTIYRECMEQHYEAFNWITFIDLDEYIVIRHPETYPCVSASATSHD